MADSLRSLTAVLVACALAAPAASADDHRKASKTFGPFEGGEAREVVRHGKKARARAPHPVVGRVDKVPGEGPPPPPLRADPDVPEDALDGVNDIGPSLSSNPLFLSALVYRHMLTKLDGPRCQHMPTCSRFANQAVAKHGAVGVLMGLDRLIKPGESSAIRTMPQVEGWGGVRFLDPVENYEFWTEGYQEAMPPPTDEEPLDLSPQAPRVDDPKEPLPPSVKLAPLKPAPPVEEEAHAE